MFPPGVIADREIVESEYGDEVVLISDDSNDGLRPLGVVVEEEIVEEIEMNVRADFDVEQHEVNNIGDGNAVCTSPRRCRDGEENGEEHNEVVRETVGETVRETVGETVGEVVRPVRPRVQEYVLPGAICTDCNLKFRYDSYKRHRTNKHGEVRGQIKVPPRCPWPRRGETHNF